MTFSRLSQLAAARFGGPEAGAFLQAQLSADILALEDGGATFACYCTPRGQVLGLLLICRSSDEFLLIAAADLLPGILQRLRMFVMRTKVEFAEFENQVVYGIDGEIPAEVEVTAYSPGETGLSYAIGGWSSNADERAWKERELRAKVCWLEPATAEKFIPQMLGFEDIGAVSFSKGCYPGQEIVARTRYLGRVKRTPLLLNVKGEFTAPNGIRLSLLLNGDWTGAVLIDSVRTAEKEMVLFVVTRVDEKANAEKIEYEGRNYRCATI